MEVADFLKHLVCAGYNIFVSGGTGSGKTTFLNALSEFIPKEERVVTIEDSAELQLLGLPNLVRLESRDIKLPGAEEITIRDLIKAHFVCGQTGLSSGNAVGQKHWMSCRQ